MKSPLCIIPARGSSKRFPRKNVALFSGKPMLAFTIEAAKESGLFERVCVSSEDEEILSIAAQFGAEPLKRPMELATDTSTVCDVCVSLLAHDAPDVFAVLQPTNPLLLPQHIRDAFGIFESKSADVVMSVVPYHFPPQHAVRVSKDSILPLAVSQDAKTQSQRLEPLYHPDGSVIIARTDVFLREKQWFVPKTMPYFIPPEDSVDIDLPQDLAWAEFLFLQRAQAQNSRSATIAS